METDLLLKRIVIDEKVMVGKPVIKGTRLTVQLILELLAQGMTMDAILTEHSKLTREDILACLTFAAHAIDTTTFSPLAVGH